MWTNPKYQAESPPPTPAETGKRLATFPRAGRRGIKDRSVRVQWASVREHADLGTQPGHREVVADKKTRVAKFS